MEYNDRDVYADSFYEGEFSIHRGDFEGALKHFQDYKDFGGDEDLRTKATKGIKFASGILSDLHFEKGRSAAETEKFDEALTNYQKAVKYNPENVQARKRLAAAYTEIGEHTTSLIHSKKAAIKEYEDRMAESNLDSDLAVRVPSLETALATS